MSNEITTNTVPEVEGASQSEAQVIGIVGGAGLEMGGGTGLEMEMGHGEIGAGRKRKVAHAETIGTQEQRRVMDRQDEDTEEEKKEEEGKEEDEEEAQPNGRTNRSHQYNQKRRTLERQQQRNDEQSVAVPPSIAVLASAGPQDAPEEADDAPSCGSGYWLDREEVDDASGGFLEQEESDDDWERFTADGRLPNGVAIFPDTTTAVPASTAPEDVPQEEEMANLEDDYVDFLDDAYIPPPDHYEHPILSPIRSVGILMLSEPSQEQLTLEAQMDAQYSARNGHYNLRPRSRRNGHRDG
jgi:hypothetical protein